MEKPSDRVWSSVERITADLISAKVRIQRMPIPTTIRIICRMRFSIKAIAMKITMPMMEIRM